jgi:hydantoinase/carbamoylase family amidase
MSINPDRISHDIETIAGFNASTADIGYSRPTFSPAWRAACDYVIAQAKSAGCKVRIDAAGNVHARHASIDWREKIWLSGSHIDSVPTGGKFDGVVGIVCPLELLRSAHAAGNMLPLELIIFAEEEGTTFGLGMIGSRLWSGDLIPKSLQNFLNADGQTYLTSGHPHGVDPELLPSEKFAAENYRGLIEVHIEQGPGMWKRNQQLAVVGAIAGRKQLHVHIQGESNHAGATSMQDRRDALAAAAACIVELEKYANALHGDAVLTVGKIICQPNAINVIPSHVEFTIDFRSGSANVIDASDGEIRKLIEEICRRRGLKVEVLVTEHQPPQPMDEALVQRLVKLSGNAPLLTSGALHDAAILAPLLPTAMLFIPSKDGISHNPAEFSRIEDIAAAARVLEKLVTGP